MGIRSRIKKLLPIVGGDPVQPRPTQAYKPSPSTPEPARKPEPPPAPRSAEAVQEEIDALVKGHPIVVFMKGSPHAPACGFSARVGQILLDSGAPIEHRNVLADPAIRSGIKQYTDWPTIPQVFIAGEFVGGSDIVAEMHESGELKTLIAEALETA
jgi:monothiol glutaredoxin